MSVQCTAIKSTLVAGALFCTGLLIVPAHAQTQKLLEGNITKSGTIHRLARPVKSARISRNSMPPKAPPIRISRKPAKNLVASRGSFDVSTFKNGFKLEADHNSARLGIAKSSDFLSRNKFDLGTERNSRELLVAWEKWHKQLSKAIYDTWSARADEPGRTTLKVIVNKDRSLRVVQVDSNASRRFNRVLRSAIMSLEGNPGLSFPSKSQRQFVSFEADYVAARNVTPGYSWVKGDFEKVQEHY